MSLLLCLLLQIVAHGMAQDCLLATNGQSLFPDFIKPGGTSEMQFSQSPVQAIITSFVFNCSGVIAEWKTYVNRNGDLYNGTYSISFQVWRPNSPSPINTDGGYTMIGSNTFNNIILDPDVRGLVRETPSVSERIQVQLGDVVGFHLTNSRRTDNGIQFSRDSQYVNETVWYAISTVNYTLNNIQVGPSGSLDLSTNLAPAITASVVPLPSPTTLLQLPTTTNAYATSVLRVNPTVTVPGTFAYSGPIAGISVSLALTLLMIGLIFITISAKRVFRKREALRRASEGITQLAANQSILSHIDQTNQDCSHTCEENTFGTSTSALEISTSLNNAYGRFESITEIPPDSKATPTSDNPDNLSYTYISTTKPTTEQQAEYYVNEGMDSPWVSDTYGDIKGHSSTSCEFDTPSYMTVKKNEDHFSGLNSVELQRVNNVGELQGNSGQLQTVDDGELQGNGGELQGNGGELQGNGGELQGNGGELQGNCGELQGNGGELQGNGGELQGKDGDTEEPCYHYVRTF